MYSTLIFEIAGECLSRFSQIVVIVKVELLIPLHENNISKITMQYTALSRESSRDTDKIETTKLQMRNH